MSEAMITFEVVWGSIVAPRPTGEWVQDPDGWWRELWTDTIHLDGEGREISREPTPGYIRSSQPPWGWGKRKGWLRRLAEWVRG